MMPDSELHETKNLAAGTLSLALNLEEWSQSRDVEPFPDGSIGSKFRFEAIQEAPTEPLGDRHVKAPLAMVEMGCGY
jgi:hypothetical protein